MPEGADVTIRYAFLPTKKSITDSANLAVKALERRLGTSKVGFGGGTSLNESMKKSSKKMTSEFDNTVNSIIDFLRATQQKTSLQTKLMSGLKLVGKVFGGGETSGASGAGGEGAGAVAGGAGGGGMMAALGIMIGLLLIISIVMTLIGAFFDAVGPIIKVVMKMVSAMILILLMPFLKRGLPVLFGILKFMIQVAKGISGLADSFMTSIENIFARIFGGDVGAIFELLLVAILGPIGMLILFLGPKLIEFLSKIDWGAMVEAVIPMLRDAFEIIKSVVDDIGERVFGKQTWLQIIQAVNLIKEIFSKDGVWNLIKETIDWLGANIFGKEMWETLKSSITTAIDGIIATLSSLSDAIQTITKGITDFWNKVVVPNSFGQLNRISTAPTVKYPKNEYGYDKSGIFGSLFGKGDFSGGATSKGTRAPGGFGLGIANDFISRPGGGIQKFNSSDTIIGTKNPGALGGINITNNLTVSAGVEKAEFKKLLTEFSRQQARDLRTRTSYYGR